MRALFIRQTYLPHSVVQRKYCCKRITKKKKLTDQSFCKNKNTNVNKGNDKTSNDNITGNGRAQVQQCFNYQCLWILNFPLIPFPSNLLFIFKKIRCMNCNLLENNNGQFLTGFYAKSSLMQFKKLQLVVARIQIVGKLSAKSKQ